MLCSTSNRIALCYIDKRLKLNLGVFCVAVIKPLFVYYYYYYYYYYCAGACVKLKAYVVRAFSYTRVQ